MKATAVRMRSISRLPIVLGLLGLSLAAPRVRAATAVKPHHSDARAHASAAAKPHSGGDKTHRRPSRSAGKPLAKAGGHRGGRVATAHPAERRARATLASKPRQPAARARARSRYAPVELYAVNGKDVLMLRLRDDRGRPLRGVQKRFDHFLRCRHTNTQHPMNPRLVRLLYQVGRHYDGRRIDVVSGYRHPSVAKNPRSPHMQGLACDFHVEGIRNQDLRDYLRRGFEKVGVGYYPNSSFVHLDVRKDHSAFWIDYSGPGERANYADDPLADLKSGRADTYKPTKIDQNWVEGADGPGDDDGPPAGTRAAAAAEAAGAESAPAREPGASDTTVGSIAKTDQTED